jgi:phosphate transport system substrate-binding protein
MLTTDAIVQSVSENEGAIGYIGLAYLNNSVKAINVAYDSNKYIEPSMGTAWDRSYPITRPLYFFYEKSTEKKYSQFINFVLSAKGQKIVEDVGYVPVNLNCK